jgi:hypothetical protein
MSYNPYEPPKSDPRRRGLDRFGETRNHRDELMDWSGFFFVVTILFLILFHHVLIDFFIDIFRDILYNK